MNNFITPDISNAAYYPIWCILLPVFGAFLVMIAGKRERIRQGITVLTVAVNFILLLMMINPVINGIGSGGELYKGLFFKIEYFYTYSFSFKVDPVSLLIALATNFVWLMSVIYAIGYMRGEHKRTRYDFFVLISLMMNLGVLLAGDLLTLFIFFEGMLLALYPLVIHEENESSRMAAKVYLYMGVATGLCLLAGIFLLNYFTGSLDIGTMGDKLGMLGVWKYIIAGLLILGFGGKAGIFFEHIWLPLAHPVAPSPASAILSGAVIKAGAYGIIRVVNMFYLPVMENADNWLTMSNIGYVMIWIGVLTMFLGVLSALISSNAKKMLAFHSISQMGYIVMGIGCAAYLGKDGAMGLSGALYHIINHALFKASLFLCAGAVYFRTKELDMYKLGGLWKNMPVTCVCLFIAVCGISGMPGFNGFASKTLLHHSIVEAYEHSSLYFGKPDKMLRVAEIIFMLTAGGTFASNFKLFILIFLGKNKNEEYKALKEVPFTMKISLISFSAMIIFIGLFPNLLLKYLISPGVSYLGYEPLGNGLFTGSEILRNLPGVGTVILLGGIYFVLGFKLGWFHVRVPRYLTVEYYYRKIFNGFINLCSGPVFILGERIKTAVQYIFLDFWQGEDLLENKTSWRFFDKIDTAVDNEINKISLIGKNWRFYEELEDNYSKKLDKLVDTKKYWEIFKKVDSSYEMSLDKAVYSVLGLEELRVCKIEPEKIPGEKAAPWFMKLTQEITLLDSGDISNNIALIIFTLSILIALLIGIAFFI
ncbi:MAG: proton-conducting transporter membrane subunit [bacterium]|nr:proton-conducting transporter membrane subunit [bacterium]